MSADHLTAQTELTLSDRTYTLAVTPSVGFLTNFVHTHAPYVSADLDTNLWFLVRGLHALLEVGYALSRAELHTEEYTSTLHSVPVVLSAAYRVHVNPKISLSLAAGIGAHILRNRSRGPGGLDTVESTTQLGARGTLTAGFRVRPGDILLRGGFLYARPTRIQSVSGNTGGMLWAVGYRTEFI
jgi:hypothetical protein